ncbi:hypothetical protein QAD02_004615 [Eretmocerus hayati]|uniref:Uncharacterized protein n=1 Tax=Eretmocerus hayati TaxID=131215 RepID=A0ACC2NRA0_9HYME|nr:hypothetical protein QAD02_004615 [Eretmocerus hayati]
MVKFNIQAHHHHQHRITIIRHRSSSNNPVLDQTLRVLQVSEGSLAKIASTQQNGSSTASSTSLDDEWKNIHVMLNCILGMVDKTKRALAILQKRGCTSPAASATTSSTTTSSTGVSNNTINSPLVNGSSSSAAQSNGPQQISEQLLSVTDVGSLKRLSGEIVAQTIRATEDRVAEVKRKAEEAVQEVKRAAVAEVQRAVAAALAESRAGERYRNQRYLDGLPIVAHQQQIQRAHQPSLSVRPSPFLRVAESRINDEPDKDTIPPSSSLIASGCWNCGRPALETCGGCGLARYCGSFCQHRDWEAGGHHASCSSTSNNNPNIRIHQQQTVRSSSPPISPTRTTNPTATTTSAESSPSILTPTTGSECSGNTSIVSVSSGSSAKSASVSTNK